MTVTTTIIHQVAILTPPAFTDGKPGLATGLRRVRRASTGKEEPGWSRGKVRE